MFTTVFWDLSVSDGEMPPMHGDQGKDASYRLKWEESFCY